MALTRRGANHVGHLRAGTDLSAKANTFVKLDSTYAKIFNATASTDTVLGVIQGETLSGEACEIWGDGSITKVVAAGAITVGNRVRPTTDGKATPASGAGQNYGVALDTVTTDGDLVTVLLERSYQAS